MFKKLSFKLFVVCASFAIPIGVLIALMVKSIEKDINFATQEKYGNSYQVALTELTKNVSKLQILEHLKPTIAKPEEIALALASTEDALKKLQKVNSEFGVQLAFTEEGLHGRNRQDFTVEKLQETWAKYKEQSTLETQNTFNKEASTTLKQITKHLRSMITHMGDTSNLILDPDLDSYYLMDATLLALPQTAERLEDIYMFMLSEKNSPNQNNLDIEAAKTKSNVFAAMLKESDVDRISASIDTALNEDKNFYGIQPSLAVKLLPLKSIFVKELEKTIAFLQQKNGNLNSLALYGSFIEAQKTLYDLHFASFLELNKLLDKRIYTHKRQEHRALFLTFVALLVAAFLAYLLSSNLVKRVQHISFVSKLISNGNTQARVLKSGSDEISELGESFNKMTETVVGMSLEIQEKNQSLAAINANLESKVSERTATLNERNKEMKMILDNAEQGFVTVHASGQLAGKMMPERSKIIETWFGNSSEKQNVNFWEYLFQHDLQIQGNVEFAWSQIIEDILPLDVSLYQMPNKITNENGSFHISYIPILNENKILDKMLLVISDETVLLQQKALEAQNNEQMKVFQSIMRDKQGFLEFISENETIVEKIAKAATQNISLIDLKRALHTVKGNCGLFGISTIVDFCHNLEGKIEEIGTEIFSSKGQELLGLQAVWNLKMDSIMDFLGEKSKTKIELEISEYTHAIERIRAGADSAELQKIIFNWGMEPLSVKLERFGIQAKKLADKIGKPNLTVEIEANKIRVPSEEYAEFFSVFSHVIRNAIDHGIESPEEREVLGKPPQGKLILKTWKPEDANFCLKVTDDGKGIDWQKVEAKAKKLGIPCTTLEEKIDALFSDGFSTREVATLLSGRGVGLASIRQICKEKSYKIDLETEFGKGTSFVFTFPKIKECTAQHYI